MERDLSRDELPSKNHGMSAVKAAAFAPAELVSKVRVAAQAAGFREEEFGRAGECPLIALTRRIPGPRPRVYVSTGIHGDEPAPPLALLSLLRSGLFDGRANWILCPLLNPAGFRAQTRENAGGIDLNRDYCQTRSEEVTAHLRWLRRQPNFDFYLTLHEDWEATGFYLYEINPRGQKSHADAVIAAVGAICPIDLHDQIDGRPAVGGIIRPQVDTATVELWPESFYLRSHHAARGCTLETPSGYPLAQRILAMQVAVTTVLKEFLG